MNKELLKKIAISAAGAALLMLVYNKSVAVRKVLGGA